MKYFRFLVSLILFSAFTIFLSNSINIGGENIPAMGDLLNPFSGFWQNAESDAIGQTISFDTKKLSDKVEVYFDDRMVPHIFSKNFRDALYVQGRLLAENRLWQMDFIIRAAGGTLSEILGKKTLGHDLSQRRLGMKYAAEQTAEGWEEVASKNDWADLQAFVDGVNDHIDGLDPANYPIEFKLLGYAPEKWSVYKCALVSRYMAQTLCSRNHDREATATRKLIGEQEYDYLFPEWNPKQSPVISKPSEIENVNIGKANKDDIGQLPTRIEPEINEFIGSNNWAISAQKSATGNAILCNDPHLQLNLPSIWYETHISCPETNVYGVSIPGAPGIIIGFNDDIAWGSTNVGIDVLDWYEIEWTDKTKTKYLVDGKILDAEIRYEKIKVKGGNDVVDSLRMTIWGPVTYLSKDGKTADLACRWIAHDKPTKMDNIFLDIDRCKSYSEFDAVLSRYHSPAQNLVSATKDGDIAMNVQGTLPIKSLDQGKYVQAGNTTANAWKGFIPESELPQSVNPERGFVSSANQHSTSPDYPYYYNGYFADYRGRLINEVLDDKEKVTVEDVKNLQLTTESLLARELLAICLPSLTIVGTDKKWVQELKNWNHRFDRDLQIPILFDLWMKQIPKDLWDELPVKKENTKLKTPEYWRTLSELSLEESKYFDIKNTNKIETKADILNKSFKTALKSFYKILGEGKKDIWYKYKEQTIRHMARIPSFSHETVYTGGYRYAPNANSKYHGPSWRMVVEFSKPIKAYGVYPGGQSGNPGSRYYDNMIEAWSEGKYYELNHSGSKESFAKTALLTQIYN